MANQRVWLVGRSIYDVLEKLLPIPSRTSVPL